MIQAQTEDGNKKVK